MQSWHRGFPRTLHTVFPAVDVLHGDGTFITTNEPRLMRSCSRKSVFYSHFLIFNLVSLFCSWDASRLGCPHTFDHHVICSCGCAGSLLGHTSSLLLCELFSSCDARVLIEAASPMGQHRLWGVQVQSFWHMGSAAPQYMEYSQIRDRTPVPDIGGWILNQWTTREVPW